MSYKPSNPNGQATMANSEPVVIASDQSAVPISGTIGVSGTIPTTVVSGTISTITNPISVSGTVPVSGTITANAGTNLNTSLLALESGGNLATVVTNTTNIPNLVGTAASAIPSKLMQIGGSDGTLARAIKTLSSGQLDIRPLTSADVVTSTISGTVPVSGTISAAQSGTWTVQPGNTANTTAWKVDGSAVTQPVSGTVTSTPTKSATATLSNVAASVTSVTILASNANRLGATIYNDSSSLLYLKFGSTASSTSFTVPMLGNSTAGAAAYYEVPANYTGIITGIWVSATGNARVTELTA